MIKLAFIFLAPLAFSAELKCKEVKVRAADGCNICTVQKCTDGKTQWSNGPLECTAVNCASKIAEEKYDPKYWGEKK